MRVPVCALAILLSPLVGRTVSPAQADDTGSDPAGNVRSVLGRMVQAYGGRELLSDFPGFRARGKVLSLGDGVNGSLRLELSMAGDLRSEVFYPRGTEIRILAGPVAWSGGKNRQRLADREMTASMRLQFHRLAAPFELAVTEPESLVWEGWSDEGYARMRRDWSDESHTTYEIDPGSGQIRRIRGEVGSGENAMRFETESADFREVTGTLFPFRMTTTVSGHAAWEVILDRVEREGSFDPQAFLPSGSAGDI